jgi:polyphosphate kinase 2
MAKKKKAKKAKKVKKQQVNPVEVAVKEQSGSDELAKEKEPKPKKLKLKTYEKELTKLQAELVHLQEWVKQKDLKVVVIFEGRDAAGKGGIIKRITERVSPRVFRVVALPAPTEREKTQLYFQRYVSHLPAAGEIVLFDRSWYNRAGVEHVMGFCKQEEYEEFMRVCPPFEETLIRSGIILLKYFLDVSQAEQKRRFLKRINDPMRHWKLSPMDIKSYRLWWVYTKAYDRMIFETDTEIAPWYIVKSDDKRRARLNCITHLLSMIPYKKLKFDAPELSMRRRKGIIPEVY